VSLTCVLVGWVHAAQPGINSCEHTLNLSQLFLELRQDFRASISVARCSTSGGTTCSVGLSFIATAAGSGHLVTRAAGLVAIVISSQRLA
jgi:hypothetical protein